MLDRRWLGAYAAVFAAAGVAFIAAPGSVLALVSAVTGAAPPGGGEASLWLGLTGSLMAVLTLLAWELSRAPGQPAVWRALLLSKGVSAALFVVFASKGGAGFLAAALVDGAILLHLAFLREAHEPLEAWAPAGGGIGHEAFFLVLRDAASGAAFWLRHEAGAAGGRCQWAVTDRGGVRQGEWPEPPFAGFGRRGSRAAGPGGSWDLTWDDGSVPPYALVPRWLWRLGLAGTMYVTSAPAARVSGSVSLDGRRWELSGAPGCVGHVWGRRRAARWRWAHAYWPERGVAVEALTAQGRLGRWRTPPLTATVLWRGGRPALKRSWDEGTWTLRLEPPLTCELAAGGLVVRHCTAGWVELGGLSGPAAVEEAEEP